MDDLAQEILDLLAPYTSKYFTDVIHVNGKWNGRSCKGGRVKKVRKRLTTLQIHKNQTTTVTASGNLATSLLNSPSLPLIVCTNSVVMYR